MNKASYQMRSRVESECRKAGFEDLLDSKLETVSITSSYSGFLNKNCMAIGFEGDPALPDLYLRLENALIDMFYGVYDGHK